MKIIYGKKFQNDPLISIDETDLGIPVGPVYNEDPVKFVNKLAKESIQGKKITEWLEFHHTSLWWYVLPSIYLSVSSSINFIKKFEMMLEEKKPDVVKVVGEFEKFFLIKQMCNNRGIKVQVVTSGLLRHVLSNWLKNKIQPYRHKIYNKKKLERRLSAFKTKGKQIPKVDDKIMFALPTSYRRNIYIPSRGGDTRGEFLIEPVFEIVKKLGMEFVCLDIDYSFKGQDDVLEERLSTDIPWFPLECILDGYSVEIRENILRTYVNLINRKEFRSLFKFNEINFWSKAEDEFKKLSYDPYLPTYVKIIRSLEKYFSSYKPKAILMPYEKGPLALALIVAGKTAKITTIGMQHGAPILGHPDYVHDEYRTEENHLGFPLPDITLVFGESYKKYLETIGYPNPSLVVFGNPQFFDISNVLQKLDRSELRKKYSFPLDKKIIIFTTSKLQRHYKFEGKRYYDEQVLEKLIKEFGNDGQFFIVLKPHPANEPIYAYEEIINKSSCNNIVIKQGNLIEMIYLSDILVSVESTTLIDCMVVGRPLIEVKFGDSVISLPYGKDEVIFLSSLELLSENIKRMLSDDGMKEKYFKLQKKFIKDLFNVPADDTEKTLYHVLKDWDIPA